MTPKHLKYLDAIVALAIATAFLLIAQHAESAEVDSVFDYATGTQYLCVSQIRKGAIETLRDTLRDHL
jgi:hypothetical protein